MDYVYNGVSFVPSTALVLSNASGSTSNALGSTSYVYDHGILNLTERDRMVNKIVSGRRVYGPN